VVPRRHVESLWDIDGEDLGHVVRGAQRVALLLRRTLGSDGVNLVQATGRAAWQSVFHFHFHVIPRWDDDGLRRPWIPSGATEAELDAVLERVLAAG
jgi:histidine triad (HIT) family protein